ncbi:MAG: CoA transferase [Clostridia bacterium]|nr:CoA transferase [Clostridia bacterium]
MDGPLSGIKVVELATFVAGPVTARLLADMGAEVIKVEAPEGDGWRASGVSYLPRFNSDENPIFDIYNAGKKHISLNLKTAEGKEVLHKLLAEADVLVTNTRPAALRRLGFSYEELKERYPRLIFAAVLGYGEKGPEAHKPAFDTTAFWARSGFLRDMAVVTDEYFPVTGPSGVGDTATGYLLMGEICAALYRRTVTGKGDYVSSGLYHNGVFCMGTMVLLAQDPFGRFYPYNRVDNGVIGGSYQTADGDWIYFALGNGAKTIAIYLKLMGLSHLAEDPLFAPEVRWQNRYEIYELFKKAFLSKTAAEWVALADEYDLPLVRMAHFKDVSKDPQAWANGYVEQMTFRNGNVDVMPTSPIEMASVTPRPTKPAPLNGGDTVEVLRGLGYREEEIQAMIAAGAAVAVHHDNKGENNHA